jgi:hypothetical protein
VFLVATGTEVGAFVTGVTGFLSDGFFTIGTVEFGDSCSLSDSTGVPLSNLTVLGFANNACLGLASKYFLSSNSPEWFPSAVSN